MHHIIGSYLLFYYTCSGSTTLDLPNPQMHRASFAAAAEFGSGWNSYYGFAVVAE